MQIESTKNRTNYAKITEIRNVNVVFLFLFLGSFCHSFFLSFSVFVYFAVARVLSTPFQLATSILAIVFIINFFFVCPFVRSSLTYWLRVCARLFVLIARANGKGSAQKKKKKKAMNMGGKASCHGSPSENWSLESQSARERDSDCEKKLAFYEHTYSH